VLLGATVGLGLWRQAVVARAAGVSARAGPAVAGVGAGALAGQLASLAGVGLGASAGFEGTAHLEQHVDEWLAWSEAVDRLG
jgi:hypothetical protein